MYYTAMLVSLFSFLRLLRYMGGHIWRGEGENEAYRYKETSLPCVTSLYSTDLTFFQHSKFWSQSQECRNQ